jgi:hypothetical protein
VWTAYIFSTRRVVGRFPAVTLSYYLTLAGFIGFLPFTLFEAGKWRAPDGLSLMMLCIWARCARWRHT